MGCCAPKSTDPILVESPVKVEPIIDCSTQENINRHYTIERVIGNGVFGTVRKGHYRLISSRIVAIKSVRKDKISGVDGIERLKRELEILQAVDHPNIIKLYDVFEDNKYIHIVTEYCDGGHLFDRVLSKGKFTEEEAKTVVKSMLRAVLNLHLNNISHRDIKPENFLFLTKADDSELKLIDFGLSSRFGGLPGSINTMESMVGTPFYVSPEVLYGPNYGPSCDIWSVGVILYVLVTGTVPFSGQSQDEIFFKIKSGLYCKEVPEWTCLSEEVKDLIAKLIVVNPTQRLDATTALKHPWLTMKPVEAAVDRKILRSLRSYRICTKLQQEALAMIVKFLDYSQIKELKDAFVQMDNNHSGFLKFDEVREVLSKAGCDSEEIDEIIDNAAQRSKTRITYSEFLAATLSSKVNLSEDIIKGAFTTFDIDKSGFITPEDLKLVLAKAGKDFTREEVVSMIEEAGIPGHQISYKAFRKMLKTIPALES